MFVDAQTYLPLRVTLSVVGSQGGRYVPGLYVTDWMPATSDNIAQAEDESIPAGYTKVDNAAG